MVDTKVVDMNGKPAHPTQRDATADAIIGAFQEVWAHATVLEFRIAKMERQLSEKKSKSWWRKW